MVLIDRPGDSILGASLGNLPPRRAIFARNEDFRLKLGMIATYHRIPPPMTVSLAFFLAFSPQVDHRALHPEDTPVYVALPQIQGYLDAYHETAVGRVLAEPEIQALVAGIRTVAGGDIAAGFEEVSSFAWGDAQSLLVGVEGLSISLSSVAEMDWGTALREGEIPAEFDQFEFRLVVDFVDPNLAARAYDRVHGALIKATGVVGIHVEVEDKARGPAHLTHFSVREGSPEQDPPEEVIEDVAETELDDEQEIGESREALVLFVQGSRLAMFSPQSWRRGWEPHPEALTQAASPLGEPKGLVVVEAELKEGLWDQSSDLTQALIPLAEGILGPYFTMLGRGGVWRVELYEGLYHVDGHFASARQFGVIGARALEGEPFDMTHPEAAVAFAASLDGEALEKLLRAEGLITDTHRNPWESLQSKGAQAFFAQLGERVIVSVPRNLSVMAAPGVHLAIPLKDSAKANEALESWMGALGQDPPEGFRLTKKAYRKTSLYTFEAPRGNPDSEAMPAMLGGLLGNLTMMFKPTIVVAGDRLLVTLSATHAKRAVRALAKVKELPPSPLAGGQWPQGSLEISHADWIQVVAGLYGAIKGLVSMAAPSLSEDETQPDQAPSRESLLRNLPEASTFSQHFAPSRRWKTRVSSGILYHSESSFGPELSLFGIGGLGGLVGFSSDG